MPVTERADCGEVLVAHLGEEKMDNKGFVTFSTTEVLLLVAAEDAFPMVAASVVVAGEERNRFRVPVEVFLGVFAAKERFCFWKVLAQVLVLPREEVAVPCTLFAADTSSLCWLLLNNIRVMADTFVFCLLLCLCCWSINVLD